jgi:DNA-binding response OmpR family regulator
MRMTVFQARFINFLARIRKILGGALTISHERKINALTPNDASTYCRGRGICCRQDTRFRAQSTIDIRTGDLVVDLKTRLVSVHDKPVRVTCREYCIFELLSVRKGAIVTKQMLLDHLYGGMDAPELKIIDVFVCNLRKKLAQATGGNHYIETVWGAAICFATRQQQGPPGHVPIMPEARFVSAHIDDRPVHIVKPRPD